MVFIKYGIKKCGVKIIAKLVIDVDKIKREINFHKKVLRNGVKICAVIKANAYGFGMSKIAKELQHMVDFFAVSRVDELMMLRKNNIVQKVLILAPIVKDSDIEKAIKLSGDITIQSIEDLHKVDCIAKKLGRISNIHVKIDTGMHRFGLSNLREFQQLLEIWGSMQNVNFEGLYSHFACSSDDHIVQIQNERFGRFVKMAKESGFNPICHISSSKRSGDSNFSYDMVRIGIDLFEETSMMIGNIIGTRSLKKGEAIGYDHAFVAPHDLLVACVDIGYGDVAVRRLSNRGQVLVLGQKCDIIGNICMDCMFVDITKIQDTSQKDVMLWGNQGQNSISVCEIASMCDTISYEILTSMSGRVKREYYSCK